MQTTETEKPKLNRRKFFGGLVADHNEKTGFDFVLDELNPDEGYKYAHATHTDKNYKITCQMDTENKMLYALYVTFTDLPHQLPIRDELTKKQLTKVIKSEAFKIRLGSMQLLTDLRKRLDQEAQKLTDNMFSDAVTEMEMQDAYDSITLAARKLLRTE